MISRLLKITGLFCKRALYKRLFPKLVGLFCHVSVRRCDDLGMSFGNSFWKCHWICDRLCVHPDVGSLKCMDFQMLLVWRVWALRWDRMYLHSDVGSLRFIDFQMFIVWHVRALKWDRLYVHSDVASLTFMNIQTLVVWHVGHSDVCTLTCVFGCC